jgi:putative tryptophan/tyrosine transport system substrate-binding protein
VNRRELFTLIGGAAAVWPLAAHAQQGIPVIAVLGSGAAEAVSSKLQMQLLDMGMRELGLLQGRDYVFEVRWANSDASRFPTLAADLLTLNPKAVVVSTNLAALTVQKLSNTVPIVDTSMNAPVASGLIASLAHPGGNLTGVSTMSDDLVLKSLEIMRELLPQVRKLSVMFNPTNPSNPLMLDIVTREAASKEISIASVAVHSPDDLDPAFDELARQQPQALMVLTDNSLQGLAEAIVTRALSRGVPAFGSFTISFSDAGALFNYARDSKEAFREAARLLQKLLNGAVPADLPVEQPTTYALTINLKTAKRLGIAVPQTLIVRADEVIE